MYVAPDIVSFIMEKYIDTGFMFGVETLQMLGFRV